MRHLLLSSILFTSLLVVSQNHVGFKALEKDFIERNQNRNLQNQKGWKWYKRWEHFQSQRLKANGELPADKDLYQALIDFQANKESHSRTLDISWYPGGPSHDYGSNPSSEMNVQVGRVNTISFHPTDASIFYVGVAQGGVWKTQDNGNHWEPLMDDLPTLRVSDIAIDPNHPDTIYACMGDYAYMGVALHTDDRKRHTHYGIGVYKSTNGGNTWNTTGLNFEQKSADSSLMRRLFVHNTKSDSLVAAGISGIWTSSDGGDNWTLSLEQQISDFEQDPNNANILYASSLYDSRLETGTSGIYKSMDFGRNWEEVASSIMDQGNMQRIELAIARSNSNYVYAFIGDVNSQIHGIYRSIDGGTTWNSQLVHSNYGGTTTFEDIGGQSYYDMALLVDATNPETIYFGGLVIARSDNGGTSFDYVSDYGETLHPDQHYFDYNPLDEKIYVCNDGGVVRTADMHTNYCDWESLSNNIQSTSFYRLSVSRDHPEYIIAGAQDNNTHYGDTINKNWSIILGGDGMECIVSPDNKDVYASAQYGALYRSLGNNGNWDYIKPSNRNGEWTTPYLLSANDPNTIYAGYDNVYKSSNQGSDWTKLSSFPRMTGSNTASPASALAVSNNEDFIYVAKRIYHSYNEKTSLHQQVKGGSWKEITHDDMKDLYITYLSTSNEGYTIWVSLGGFEEGKKIYKSDNGGIDWSNESLNLPNLPINCIIADKKSMNNLVYIASDRGVYYKTDLMTEWELYGNNLPNVIVSELELNYKSNQIYAATFGRGVWIAPAINREVSLIEANEKGEDLDFNLTLRNDDIFLFERDNSSKNGRIQIIDIMGRTVQLSELIEGEKTTEISLKNKGVFFAKYTVSDQFKVLKFRNF